MISKPAPLMALDPTRPGYFSQGPPDEVKRKACSWETIMPPMVSPPPYSSIFSYFTLFRNVFSFFSVMNLDVSNNYLFS
jgi:hypothetical protein